MRIKRLELTGFKSCMDRTVLEFPEGITGIVGPNGCGKSNIVDALRWVLGEQSAKQLRGAAMEDVIFAGNQRHGPLGAAEVSIILDNNEASDNRAADDEDSEVIRALRQASELQVTRRLYRSGEAEYLINSRPCRLRDITELFLGTGVGTKAYSMIEQGRVGQVVNAKPDELRLFIEEAAGTTLYRSRKLAAERKIERTRDNLLRVTDIVRELERQSRSLTRQARGAVRFQELKAEEELLDRTVSAGRLSGIDGEIDRLRLVLADVSGRELAARLKQEAAAVRRDTVRDERRGLESKAEQSRSAVYQARNALSELERERRFAESKVEELGSALSEAHAEVSELAEKYSKCVTEASEVDAELASMVRRVSSSSDERVRLERKAEELETKYLEWTRESDSVKTELIQNLAEQASLKNQKAGLKRRLDTLGAKAERFQQETEALRTVESKLAEEAECSRLRLDKLEGEIGNTEGGKERAAAALERSLGVKAARQREVDSEQEAVAKIRSRLESLQELHESFAGYGEGVRHFMSNGGREKTGATAVVADVVEIEKGFERAAAAVLHERLQYVVVPDPKAGVAGAEYLKDTGSGRASFIPVSPRHQRIPANVPPGYSLLSEHMTVHEGYEGVVGPLLDGVVVADSLDQASEQWQRNGYHATFVTLAGEVVEASGVVTGGSGQAADEGLLARKSELRSLAVELSEARSALGDAKAAYERAAAEAERAGKELAAMDERLHQLTLERVEVEAELELKRHNVSLTADRLAAVTSESAALSEEIREDKKAYAELSDRLCEVEARLEELESRRRVLESSGSGFDAERSKLRSAIEAARVGEAALRQKIEGFELRSRSLHAAAEDIAARREAIDARIGRDSSSLRLTTARLEGPELDLAGARIRVEESEAALAAVERDSRELLRELDDTEKKLGDVASRLESLRREQNSLDVKLKQSLLERASLGEGVAERLGLSLDELRLPLPEEARELQGCERSELEASLAAVRNKIRRLGVVNLGAIVELEEIKTRLDELTGQRDDLEKSIEDLRGTITRLNRLSRKRFHDAFNETNAIFQKTFPKLFHGGKASLSLTDENNLLETGVEIFVQPPGKKLGNLNLLSGGEKALTAIALIFSLFLYKPSPFCVLDEVDAPLDEANVGRFINMVAEMSSRSQFVLITHNKRTMERCGRLYGVTMPEPGVSKIVSVNL